jgi:hypothetical protein
MVSNNRLGGSNDPGALNTNYCSLVGRAGDSGTGTVVQFVGNYIENSFCQIGYEPIGLMGNMTSDASKTTFISSGNTLNCTIPTGTTGLSGFACFGLAANYGTLWSLGDSCMMTRADSGPSARHYVLAQTGVTDSSGLQRRAEFVSPSFAVNLSGAHLSGDTIGYFYVDGPNLTVNVSNPRYSELALGSGWSTSDKNFAEINASRSSPPSAANTFLSWDGVVQAPDSDLVFSSGAGSGSISSGPAARIMKDEFKQGIILTGANLGSTCAINEVRYDTGGATKEICICDPANTWNCAALGAKQD